MDIKDIFLKYIEPFIKLLAIFFLVAYGIGFVVWNGYLSQYGFFEYSFLQTRFLSTGILTFIPLSYPILFIIILTRRLKKIVWIKKNGRFFYEILSLLYFGIVTIFFTLSFYYYIFCIFPRIPQFLGGGRPFAKSIIAKQEEIKFLSSLNIISTPNGEGQLPIQTVYLCELYNNEKIMIIGTAVQSNMRVLILEKELFKGFQVAPLFQVNYIRSTQCSFLTYSANPFKFPLKLMMNY